jgi:Lar family restriction alleviation protein
MMNKSNKKRESIRLKPCPFCGAEKSTRGSTEGIAGRVWWVSCEVCGAGTGIKNEVIEATAAWNLRVSEVTN